MNTVPKSALPEHIDEAHEWDGKDDDQHWYTKWRKYVKGWFAFGPRATERWAKWRKYPIILVAVRGNGFWRFEDDVQDGTPTPSHRCMKWASAEPWYLSRIQLWTRWHIQIQWPLFIAAHYYKRSEDRLQFPDKADRDGKLWFFYVGAKRDADKVYWCPAIYIGRNWK